MCGRYTVRIESELPPAFGVAWPGTPVLRYNIAPSQLAPVVRQSDAGRVLEELRWGFRPSWLKERGKAQINARSETVFTSRMFKPSAMRKRCLVLASGWYEWKSGPDRKHPFLFHRSDNGLLAFAGIWTHGPDEDDAIVDNYAIITRPASTLAARVHSRMPVLVPAARFSDWLDTSDPDSGPGLLASLVSQDPDAALETYEVSPYVNKPANNTAKCIERL